MASTATFPPQPTTTPHGTKRGADNSLANDERLAKRFDLLHLENGSRLYIPVATAPLTLSTNNAKPASFSASPPPQPTLLPAAPGLGRRSKSYSSLRSESVSPRPFQNRARSNATSSPSPSARRTSAFDDAMPIDSTPYRVYINNIDDELSSSDSEVDGPIFLPEVEKHLARIPPAVLRSAGEVPRAMPLKAADADTDQKGRELVLFQDAPETVASGEEAGGVRRAILESRKRARAATIETRNEDADADMEVESPGPANGDGDDMDMDMD